MADGSMNDLLVGLNRIIDTGGDPAAPPAPLVVPRRKPAMLGGVELPEIPQLLPESVRSSLAASVPMAVGGALSAPTALYGLADIGTNYVADRLGYGDDVHIPGGIGAQELTQQIKAPFQEMGANLRGKPVSEELLSGSPSDLIGAWTSLGLQAIPAPAAVYTKLAGALSKIKSGNAVVDGIGKGLVTAAEIATPITIAKNPGPALAANLGVSAAIGVGVESLLPRPEDTNAQAKGATDVAAVGATEADQTKHVVQAGILPPEVTDTVVDYMSDPKNRGAALLGMGLGTLAFWKRRAIYHGLTGVPKDAETVLSGPDAVRTNVQDAMTPLTSTVRDAAGRGTAAGQQIGDEFAGRTAARSGAALDARIKSVAQYGEVPESTIKFTPTDDIKAQRQNMDEATQKVAMDYMNAQREWDMRVRIANQDLGLRLGSTPFTGAAPIGSAAGRAQYATMVARGLKEDKLAYGMFQPDGVTPVHVRDLQAMIAAGEANPAVMKIARDFNSVTDGMLKYAVSERRLTPNEYRDLKRMNPNYYMTELPDGASHLGRIKIVAGGGRNALGNPLDELDTYVRTVFNSTEHNKIKRDYMDIFNRLAGNGDPTAKDIMGRRVAEGGTHNADEVVYWRDAMGKQQVQVVRDPLVRQALNNGGDHGRLHMVGGIVGRIARFTENSAVGPLATVAGSPFAPIAGIYSSVAGTVMRQSGTAAGWIDKAAQMLTEKTVGKRIGVRGDPTLLADAFGIRAPLAVSAIIVQRVAQALHHNVVNDGVLTKIISKPTLDAVATDLTNLYKKSSVYEMQQRGILGPAGMVMDKGRILDDASRIIKSNNVGVRAAVYTGDFLNDILHAISSSPTASIMAMNRDLSKDKLSHVVRDFTGDPGKQGAFKPGHGPSEALGLATSATPWGNIFIQANEKILREMRNNPVKFASGVAMAVGIPTVSASLWNARMGKEYTDYEFHVRTPERQAASIYVALPGSLPEQGLEIPIDPGMRPFKAAFQLLGGQMLGLMDGSFFDPAHQDVADGLKEMAWNKMGDTFAAAMQQSVLPPVAPVLGGPLALAGANVQNYGDVHAIPPNKEKGFSNSDGKDANAKFLGMSVGANAEAAMRAIGAQFASVVYDTIVGTEKRLNQGQDLASIGMDGMKSYQQRAADSVKPVAGLFDHALSISPSQESASKMVRLKEDNMKGIAQAYRTMNPNNFDVGGAYAGTKKRGFTELEGGPNGVVAADPLVNQLGFEVGKAYSQIQQTHLGTLKDYYDNFHSVQNSTQFAPEAKRLKLNMIGDQIIQLNRMLLTELNRREHGLSLRYKVNINFEDLDLEKPITQFPPLLPN